MTELLQSIQDSQAVYRLGWTLLHSLWLGACVAVAFSVVQVMLRRRSANARYVSGCVALVMMVVLPIAAFFIMPRQTVNINDPAATLKVPGQGATTLVKPVETLPVLALEPPVTTVPPTIADASSLPPQQPPWLTRISTAAKPALPWIVLSWAGGVVVLALWQLGGWIAAERLKRLATQPGEHGVIDLVAQLAMTMRVSRPVKILESMLVRVPTVMGWLRPVILLPVGVASGLTTAQLEAILAHELAHIRRYDYLVNLLQSLAETLLFYHPGVWYIARRIRAERENCCDDIAIAAGAERISYAESLLHLAQRPYQVRQGGPIAAATGVAATGKPSQLRTRIRRLLSSAEEAGRRGRSWPITLAFLAAALLATVLLMNVKAEPAEPGTETAAQPEASDAPSPEMSAKRDALLAQADSEIRDGLQELTKRFPQLRENKYWKGVSRPSQPGRISISLFHTDKGKARIQREPMPRQQRVSILIVVRRPPSTPNALEMSPLYPQLDLVGQIGVRAGDPELDAALKKLVTQALEPLGRLDNELGPKGIPPATPPRKKLTLGPVIERVINNWNNTRNCGLDLETGRVHSRHKRDRNSVPFPNPEQIWWRDHNVDLRVLSVGHALEDEGMFPDFLVQGLDLQVIRVDDKLWSDADAATIAAEATKAGPTTSDADNTGGLGDTVSSMAPPSGFPACYAFRTRDGNVGLVRIVGYSKETHAATIRYRLVHPADPTPWGKTVNQLQCRLLPQVQTVPPHSGSRIKDRKVNLVYQIRNVGTKPVRIWPWSTPLLGMHSSSTFHVTGPDGNPAKYEAKDQSPAAPRPDAFILIAPKQLCTYRVALSYDFTKVGRYTISTEKVSNQEELRYFYGRDANKVAKNTENVWRGELRSNVVTVFVASSQRASQPAKVNRTELRMSAEEATEKGDYAIAKRDCLALLGLPEPPLRDCYQALKLFEAREDWPSLALAYEVTAENMRRVIHAPTESFIRAAPKLADVPPGEGRGAPYVLVQTNLDGVWVKGKGDAGNWFEWIQRKQKEFRQTRIELLKKLGELCLFRLDAPRRAVTAYEVAGRGVPLCTEALVTLIPQIWPKRKVKVDGVLNLGQVGAAQLRFEILDGLAEAQMAADDLRAATETRLRCMLAMLLADADGDWNAHGPMREAERYWELVRRMPGDKSLPAMLWLNVLDQQNSELVFPTPEDGPHGLPYSFPGPNLVIRPGQKLRTMTVSADMETPGGNGGVRCYTMIEGKAHDLGRVNWHKDGRRGREWRSATFAVPENAGIIRLRITPASGDDFHVYELKVKATFALSTSAPVAQPPAVVP
jgi:beta-lactamase regulating signal transducer with metallopeptidase domain